MAIYFHVMILIFVLQYVKSEDFHQTENENACDSELVTEIRKMQKKIDTMEGQISRLTQSTTEDCMKCDGGKSRIVNVDPRWGLLRFLQLKNI